MNDSHSRYAQTIPSLDGIRAVSVLIVVLGHSGLEGIVPGGLGVTIFFFLSGYLITTLMLSEHLRTGKLDIPKFYARRMFRLMPPLLVTLAIAYGLTLAGLLAGGITAAGLAAQLLYFANYYSIFFDPGNTIPDGTGILWSLAVEEHFYIFYPLLMYVLLGRNLSAAAIARMLVVACIVILAWRYHLVQAADFVSDRTYYASDTRIDSIMFGCVLALVMNPARDLDSPGAMSPGQWSIVALALTALLATLLYRNPTFRESWRYSIQGLALMPLFYFAIRYSDNAIFRHMNAPWIKKIGVYSYAIYLIHYVIIKAIAANAPALATKFYIVFPIALLLSIAFAAAVDRYVDQFFRQLRHKYRPAQKARAAVLSQST